MISVASGFAWLEKEANTGRKVFGLGGDGEADEGQVYEMMHFANKYKLNNYILFMEHNRFQLMDSTAKISKINTTDTQK